MRANAGDFDNGHSRRKAGRARRGIEALRDGRRRDLADQATTLAYQKCHHRGLVMIVGAGEKRVAAFDAMDETIFHQEIKRTIDRDRRWPRGGFRQFLDDLVGAERPVTGQQRFQHSATDRCQFLRASGADPFGMQQRVRGATAVIVIGRGECRLGQGHPA